MNKSISTVILILIFFIAGTLRSEAQCMHNCSHDSLWTVCLTEVMISPCKGEADPVYTYFRPNKSFSTEDILSRIPALTLIRRSGFGQEPGIRGLSGSRLNITLDGMKLFGACTDKMDPVTIYVEPQNLEGFEVGTGAKHGSTPGGSLDMQLKEPAFGSGKFLAGLVGTSWHSISNSLSAFGGLDVSDKRWAARINGVYRKSMDYRTGGGTTVPYSQYEKNNLSLSLKYRLGFSQSIKLDLLTDNGYQIGFPALSMDVREANANIASLSWNYDREESLLRDVEIKIYGNSIRHVMDDRDRPGLAMYMDMPGKSRTEGVYAMGSLYLSKKILLHSKLDYYSNILFAEMFMYPEGGRMMYMLTLPESRRQVAGLYLSPEIRIDSLSSLILGVRMDAGYTQMNDRLGLAQMSIFFPEADSVYTRTAKSLSGEYKREISKRFHASFQAGWSDRLPSLQEMFGYYLYNRLDGYDYVGNPELENESSMQVGLGLQYESQLFHLSLSPFLTVLHDYIEGIRDADIPGMTSGAHGVKTYYNTGNAVMKGSELSLKYNPSNAWTWISTGKYIHGERSDGRAMWQIPPFKSLTSLKYRKGLYSVQAETEWSAQQHRIDAESGESKTPSYIIFHIRGSAVWMIGKNSIELNGGIENITDHLYHEHLDWGGIPRPGRNFYMTMAFRF